MNLKLFAIFFLALMSFTGPVFAQAEKLSESDYNAALAAALSYTSSRDRRIITEERFYTNDQTTGHRTIVSEFAGNDAKRISVAEDFGGKAATRKSVVVIGDRSFCREGKKEWKRASGESAKVSMVPIPDGKYEYFVETDARNPSVKTYIRRAAFEDAGSPEREAARLKVIEIRIVADDNGMIEYTETRRGGSEPGGWSSKQVTKYFYEPADLKISDPTKEN